MILEPITIDTNKTLEVVSKYYTNVGAYQVKLKRRINGNNINRD